MEEVDTRKDEELLALHLGALYSCPTELLLEGRVPRNSLYESSGEISARCLVPVQEFTATTPLLQSNDRSIGNQRHRPIDDDVHVEGSAGAAVLSVSGSGPIREVFCRAVPLLPQLPSSAAVPRPSDSSPTPGATVEGSHDGVIDGLREALGLMYRDLHTVRSPYRPSAAVAEPKTHRKEDGGVVVDDAAQPRVVGGSAKQATPMMLSACTRLHAGLVPLYTPLVESDDGVFLVSNTSFNGA